MSQDIVDRSGFTLGQISYYIVEEQQGNLFKGSACPKDNDRTDLYGVLDRKDIYVTAWDSISYGKVNGKGTEIEAISQKQNYDVQNDSSTSTVVATKISSDPYSVCP